MPYLAEIILPAGTRAVSVLDIPNLLADAIHPRLPEGHPEIIIGLYKRALNEHGQPAGEREPLTAVVDTDSLSDEEHQKHITKFLGLDWKPGDALPFASDWDYLSVVWSGLPPFRTGITLDEWKPYAEAYERYHIKPPWKLTEDSFSGELYSLLYHDQAKRLHAKEIAKAVARGELVVRSKMTLLPEAMAIEDKLLDAIVFIEDFRLYAATFHIGVTVAELSQREKRKALDAAGLKHISAAPPPITPLRGSSYSPPRKPEPLPLPGTDWELWRHMPKATITEAVAVSLDIEPSALKSGCGYAEPGKEFDRRIKLACAYVNDAGPLRPQGPLGHMHLFGGPIAAVVSMPEFAKWALSMGWTLPEQFPIFKDSVHQPVATETVPASSTLLRVALQRLVKNEVQKLNPPAPPSDGAAEATDKPWNNWDEYGLRRLLKERNGGMTQQQLADKYEVSRQRIAFLLTEAEDQLKPRNASPFDPLNRRNGKK